MSKVMECPRCEQVATWVDGLQFGLSKCTCPCHKDTTTKEAA